MYETMVYWETHTAQDQPPHILDYAGIWQAADKVVYSRTLDAVSSAPTRIERGFDPRAVRELKAAADRDLTMGGAELAAHALRAGLVDELQLLLAPVIVGAGKRTLPDGLSTHLELLDERRFVSGMVFLRYRVAQ